MRRVRKKGGNKEKVFGCDLLEHLTASSQDIPQVLRCCSEFVEQNGIVDGIYRLSGVSSNIQKLRSEFESDGSPDLNKDVYLQDIHCVSSLCKAYFRELPNPLLTYQLYDKFAEAVAIQLEEERLVKIRDVLKELSAPHHRTLEFLMRHLVKMASFSSETNMHARNLAIVWAPNLLRSKDIETSGFNGTAAFMEVRVQSIVVEFILTHVPQLFPEIDVSSQRRKSLPSPSAMSNQDEAFTLPVPNFGNISPGDGPLPIRPYHAIIEGTDKRKGSLKGRKWMSIFNIGGRFHDQRRRQKHSSKEKDRPALRPARSMDSLSTPPYTSEGSRHPAQHPRSTHTSPTATPAAHPGPEITTPTGAIGASEYAVTYRRGTGLVSGGAGTQGTYTSLDPAGSTAHEAAQSRSPGLSTKVGRRAAMHITGPTMVTVPLHITSNLALGVLQGGGGDRVIHRGRDKEGGDRVEGKEEREKAGKRKSKGSKRKAEGVRKTESNKSSLEEKSRAEAENNKSDKIAEGEIGEEKGAGAEEEQEVKTEQPPTIRVQSSPEEQGPKSCSSNTKEDLAVDDDQDYMVMKGVKPDDPHPEMIQQGDDGVPKVSDFNSSTDVSDPELSGYVQDNFDFLDQMDCSALDHMDRCDSYQVNEFSVEPPGHSDDEYEIMEQEPACLHPAEAQTHPQAGPETCSRAQPEPKPHRPLSLDLHSRHTKSLSLPHMISPGGAEESASEEESAGDDSGDTHSSCEEDEFFLGHPDGLEPDGPNTQDGCTPAHRLQGSEETVSQSPTSELSECGETTDGDRDREDEEGLDEQEVTQEEEKDEASLEQEELQNNKQRKATEEDLSPIHHSPTIKCVTPEATSHGCVESSAVADAKTEEATWESDPHLSECKPPASLFTSQLEASDAPSEESRDSVVTITGHPESSDSEDSTWGDCEGTKDKEAAHTGQQLQGIKECSESLCDEPKEESWEETAAKGHGSSEEQVCAVSLDIWDELEEVVCEVIEYEESKRSERGGAAGQAWVGKDGEAEETATFSEETPVEADRKKESKTELRSEPKAESLEANEGKRREPQMQDDVLEDEIHSSKMAASEKATQKEDALFNEALNHSGAEVDTKQPESENNERRTPGGFGERPHHAPWDVRGFEESRKESPSGLKGVGRKLVVSKHPKVYQVKAVPVVPPKPQHCKITALNLRQQQQHRETTTDTGQGREKTQEAPAAQDRADASVDESTEKKDTPALRDGGDNERDRRRDGVEAAVRDASRNSPLSMCFDEAVAIATMRRERERREGECEADGAGK